MVGGWRVLCTGSAGDLGEETAGRFLAGRVHVRLDLMRRANSLDVGSVHVRCRTRASSGRGEVQGRLLVESVVAVYSLVRHRRPGALFPLHLANGILARARLVPSCCPDQNC